VPRVQPHWNARAATKRGVVLPSLLERLKPYAVEGLRNTALPTHFIHFSQIEKVGLKLKSEYNTPLGIYTYPLTHYTLGLLERGRLPFAADRQYLILLQAKSDANLLYSEPDVPAVEYQKLVQNALRISRGERYLIALAEGGARIQALNLGRLWNVTRRLAAAQPKAWTALWIRLGIDGVVDNAGAKIIHENEPIQAVFFYKGAVEVVDVYRNTMAPESIKRRERAVAERSKHIIMSQLAHGRTIEGITLSEPLVIYGGHKDGLTLPSMRIRDVTWDFPGLCPLVFRHVNAPGSDFVRLPGLEIEGCDLSDSSFREIPDVKVRRSNIMRAEFKAVTRELFVGEADATDCQVDLKGDSPLTAAHGGPSVLFAHTYLDSAQIRCGTLPAVITLDDCKGGGFRLHSRMDKPITALYLMQSQLPRADFGGLEAKKVFSHGAVDLRDANFRQARIGNLVLEGVARALPIDLRGTSFAGAKIDRGEISNALIDSRTVLPDNVKLHHIEKVD